MKTKLILIFIFGIFLISFISATSDLEISIKPHYYLKGSEVVYTSDIQFTDISFEIIGKNYNKRYRILNLSCIDGYPIVFRKALPENMVEMLRIQQQKTLFISQLIDIENLRQFNQTNISLWVGVDGIHEETKKAIYAESHLDIILSNKTEEKPGLFFSIGDKIWEDNPTGGLFIILVGIVIAGFCYWKYKGAEKLANWREKAEQKRVERKKFEEGW